MRWGNQMAGRRKEGAFRGREGQERASIRKEARLV